MIKEGEHATHPTVQIALQTRTSEKSPVGDCRKNGDNLKSSEAEHGGDAHGYQIEHPTSYFETLIHFLKGNVGSGVFVLADGFKNAGIILAPILTVFLGLFCLYCEHILLTCSSMLRERLKLPNYPAFPDTIQLGFENGPRCFRVVARQAKNFVNISIITTHLGFCCVYFIFISSTSQYIMATYGVNFSIRLHLIIVLFPLMFSSMIRSLKFLVPMSLLANFCLGFGICATIYLIGADLPPISSRNYIGGFTGICLFYGTVMYSFEGIGLVLPLKLEMKNPEMFDAPVGVLNIGMGIVITVFTGFGFLGYLRFGETIDSSVTLSLPPHNFLSEAVRISIAIGILLTYALMFYVAILVIWPYCNKKLGPFKHPLFAEIICRASVVVLTFILAEFIPHLDLFISLIGACSTTALALGFPPLCDIALRWPSDFGKYNWRLTLDCASLLIGFIGFCTGTYCSVAAIIETFFA